MGKRNDEKIRELLEIRNNQKSLKYKKKALQFECCHKDKKGNFTLKPVNGKDYIFKCRQCKDKKVDLSCVDPQNGTINEQLKRHYKGLKSIIDFAKLQSNRKDEKLIETFASTLKKIYTCITILKKSVGQRRDKKNKFTKRGIHVTNGGRSLSMYGK
ncbi:MAG: hypothetical protein SPF22_08465 [Candidatus Onthovivens sp.]|nr:hypothetical protein [Candidatus Onthovivens sp.]